MSYMCVTHGSTVEMIWDAVCAVAPSVDAVVAAVGLSGYWRMLLWGAVRLWVSALDVA